MSEKPEKMFWLNDARGVYIPQNFATSFEDRATRVAGVEPEEWAVLEAGPDHEEYWDVWNSVCADAIVTDDAGVKYRLHQDGDLWFIPEGMKWSEKADDFVWPEMEVE